MDFEIKIRGVWRCVMSSTKCKFGDSSECNIQVSFEMHFEEYNTGSLRINLMAKIRHV